MKKVTKVLMAAAVAAAACVPQADAGVWKFLSAGQSQTYAIMEDGTLWAWGSAEYGELGNGSKSPAKVSTPTQIGEDTDWVFAAGGSGRAFFIKADGSLWSVGTAEGGVLGTGSSQAQLTPARIGTDNDWKYVATSNNGDNYDAMAIKTDGSLWGWGKNELGSLGLGDFNTRAVPVRVGTDNDWVSVSLGRNHTVAMKSDGSIWGAGEANNGALGDNTGFKKNFVKVSEPADWKTVTAINNATYAIKTDGTLWAWGQNDDNKLGINNAEITTVTEPTKIEAITGKVFSITGSEHFRVVATGEGETATEAYSWGWNYQGCLGNGTGCEFGDMAARVLYATPQKVQFAEPVEIEMLSAGATFAEVLDGKGLLQGWGANAWGQLGNSLPENMLNIYYTTPIAVAEGQAPVDPGVEITADNIPTNLSAVEKITLLGAWTTSDLLNLIAPIGNGQGIMGYNYNTHLKTVDMSKAEMAEGTSLSTIFRNCSALETVLFPTNGTAANIVSLDNAFLNDKALTNPDLSLLVNVKDIDQAFQNCKAVTMLDLSTWTGVESSEMAFQNSGLTSIVLPADFVISDRCFGGCDNLRLVDWHLYNGTTCPAVEVTDKYEPFYGLDFVPSQKKEIVIIVPQAAFDSFSTDSYWGGFNIQAAAAAGTYTIDGDEIPADLADALHIVLTGNWDSAKFKALATALGTSASVTASNKTLLTVDASAATIEPGTNLLMGVQGIFGQSDKGVFQNFTALESFIMPAAEQAANFGSFKQAFQGCSSLKEIDLSGCTQLTSTNDAFYNCAALAKVILPAEFTIGTECFDRCDNLREIDWSAFTGDVVPNISTNGLPTLDNNKDLVVKVPQDKLAMFQENAKWNVYTLVGVNTASVVDEIGSAEDTLMPVYTISGQYVTTVKGALKAGTLPAGIYIVGGKKVLVK